MTAPPRRATERQDLVQVTWRLNGERTGTVVAYWQESEGRLVYKKFVLNRSADWAKLPTRVAWIVHQADDPRGQWSAEH